MTDKNISKKQNLKSNNYLEEQKNNDPLEKRIKGQNSLSLEIQNKVKDIVLTRFINQIDALVKELESYKKENRLIKSDLIYVLKRILNNQIDYNPYNNTSTNLNSSMNFNKSNKSFFSSEKLNTLNNANKSRVSLNRSNNNIHLASEENNGQFDSNPYRLDMNKYNSIDNKINTYLNSLYKHNFVDNNITGSQSNYRLNNSQTIYDELFSSNKNVFKTNRSQRNIRSSEKKTITEESPNVSNENRLSAMRRKPFSNNSSIEDGKNLKVKRAIKKKNPICIKTKKYFNCVDGRDKIKESSLANNKKRSQKKIRCIARSPFLANKC